ncbi:hypothetical protein I6A60_40915 [Frankia sp. AgB1.9]|uniref:hypothetical protein n=1 Tax=unclassified Frankia TaxID=2632575 RepID=UPI0019345A49|nr:MULTISPECIES: hypothetical protein [unclassified Frankia]MBL7489132.1 hypothetical protein [Frankia sp. AgW1.1]MBL7554141.1 hypothetical protein [Frankia sp. AgB1.9]MBL7618480.1 hypothetical protein [Frankia sp. AgB1.8]
MTTTPQAPPDGPFTTEAEAHQSLLARRPDTDPHLPPAARHDHLLQAVTDAGVTLGAFDARIVAWLTHTWEATTTAVFAGLITRAHHAGKTTTATAHPHHREHRTT